MVKIPVCPECDKELPVNSTRCHHCSKTIDTLTLHHIFSLNWADRVLLFSSVLIFISFLAPWFPGEFLSQEAPLSPLNILLYIVDLDVEFLESYNILRMVLIIPLFSILLFIMVYQGERLKTTPFPGIFLIVCILVSVLTFIFQTLSGMLQWVTVLLFSGGFLFYLQHSHRKGSLGRVSYNLLFIFILISIFLYLFDLASQFYTKLDPLLLVET
jgi:hypothetical protein